MKKLVFATLLATMLSNCTSKEATETQATTTEQPETVAENTTKTTTTVAGFDYTGVMKVGKSRI